MNKVILMGRLTRDPEVRYTQNTNTLVASFSIAVNRRFVRQGEERQADFINIVVWNKQAENVCNFLDKGSLVTVEGRIQTGSYEDKDGNKRYMTDIIADSVQFLESKKEDRPEPEYVGPTPQEAANRGTSPYDFQSDPYADVGENVTIDDNFLD